MEKGKGLVLGEAKSEVEDPVIRPEVAPEGGTHVPRSGAPRTPAKGVIIGRNRTLLLAAIVALFIFRTRPLPDVAQHVVKPEGVGGETPHRSRLPVVPAAAATIAVGAVATNGLAPVAVSKSGASA